MTREEDRRPLVPERSPRRGGELRGRTGHDTRRRAKGRGTEQSFRAKPFVLGLSYGFVLGFVLEAILASHP